MPTRIIYHVNNQSCQGTKYVKIYIISYKCTDNIYLQQVQLGTQLCQIYKISHIGGTILSIINLDF